VNQAPTKAELDRDAFDLTPYVQTGEDPAAALGIDRDLMAAPDGTRNVAFVTYFDRPYVWREVPTYGTLHLIPVGLPRGPRREVLLVDELPHADYPHDPGYLYDCPACEASCHCTTGHTECVYDGDHNGTAATPENGASHE
jgi:hypothetical protein